MSRPVAAPSARGPSRSVAVVTLGCARNEVDSDELAGRLDSSGFELVAEPGDADVVLVNTCGFVEAAKRDSIDTVLAAADLKDSHRPRAVVAVGCLAERYGAELAHALPEADAVLGFDDYAEIGSRLDAVLAGERHISHTPRDRRRLLPLQPVGRQAVHAYTPGHSVPDLPRGIGPASGPRSVRRRLGNGPSAPVKLASGCDRRCSFCAIPSFRGAFLSRPPEEILAEVRWLAGQGVREVFLVSENSTSYGKDLGDLRSLEALLPRVAAVDGIDWVRVSYLQPAEMRPSLVDAIGATPGVTPYFDLSFQHASGPLLRRMRRFGNAEEFLELLDRVRAANPAAGIRSNVITGFPGETEDDLAILAGFLTAARLDVVGVFGYSDEDGTEAASYDAKVSADEINDRVARLSALVEELTAQRAEDRIGEVVEVLIEAAGGEGRAAHQGPDVDGSTSISGAASRIGDLIAARVVAADGVDLIAHAVDAAGTRAHSGGRRPGARSAG